MAGNDKMDKELTQLARSVWPGAIVFSERITAKINVRGPKRNKTVWWLRCSESEYDVWLGQNRKNAEEKLVEILADTPDIKPFLCFSEGNWGDITEDFLE